MREAAVMPSTTKDPNVKRTTKKIAKRAEAFLPPNPATPVLTDDEVKDRARHYADRVVTATAKRTGRKGGVDWTRVYIQRWRYLSGLDRTFTGPKIQPRNATAVPNSGRKTAGPRPKVVVVKGENVVALQRKSKAGA